MGLEARVSFIPGDFIAVVWHQRSRSCSVPDGSNGGVSGRSSSFSAHSSPKNLKMHTIHSHAHTQKDGHAHTGIQDTEQLLLYRAQISRMQNEDGPKHGHGKMPH